MDHQQRKRQQQLRRRRHVRKKVQGDAERPRLTVYRSSKHIYAQLVDDLRGVTLAAASSTSPEVRKQFANGGNIKVAVVVGKQLAQAAGKAGITKAAFDRGHYKYHGRIKALADAAREGGLQF